MCLHGTHVQILRQFQNWFRVLLRARLIPEKVDTLVTLPRIYLAQPLAGFNMKNKFYVYVHRKKSDGSIFYVGKGSGDRYKAKSGRNIHWVRTAKKHGFTSDIIFNSDNECCALSYEICLISSIGLDNLCNVTTGGEGVCGLLHTAASRRKMSQNRTNNPWLRGRDMPEWIKPKLRAAKLGKKQSPEHAEKSRTNKIGFKVADTSKFNLDKRKPIKNSEGEVFESAIQAARVISSRLGVNASQGNITMCVHGKRNVAYGLSWSFVDETI